jgi:site-specific recombinase XerD
MSGCTPTATLLAEQGVHVRAIQQVPGHTDVRITRSYLHVGDAMVRDAAKQIGSALWGE